MVKDSGGYFVGAGWQAGVVTIAQVLKPTRRTRPIPDSTVVTSCAQGKLVTLIIVERVGVFQ